MTRPTPLVAFALSCVALLAVGCGAGTEQPASQVEEPTAVAPAESPTRVPGVELAPFKSIDAKDGLTITSSGGPTLMVLVEKETAAAAVPPGWDLVGPVRRLEARKQGRVLASFDAALELRFKEEAQLARVMREENGRWVFAYSTVNGDGTVSADITKPGTFALMKLTRKTNIALAGRYAPIPAATAVARFAATPPTPTMTVAPRFSKSGTPYPTATSRPTITPTPVRDAETAAMRIRGEVEPVLKGVRGRTTALESTTSYEAIVDGERVTMLYGTYEGANEVITSSEDGALLGDGYIVIEPQADLPASAAEAQAELLELFPFTRRLVMTQEPSLGPLVFRATEYGSRPYTLGFVTAGGVPVAFVASGYDKFYTLGYFDKTRIPK